MYTTAELQALLGENLRRVRLQQNIDIETLAMRAGVSRTALQKLETGGGSSIKTLVAVVKVLGRMDWINALAPQVSINPLDLVRRDTSRKRATGSRGKPASSDTPSK